MIRRTCDFPSFALSEIGELYMESLFQPNVSVQRRRYAVRWNRLLADRFFVALSEAFEDVYATVKPG
jgi:hypothetical protein